MQRATLILLTTAFAVACVGLWLFISVVQCVYPPEFKLRGASLPVFTQVAITFKTILLLIPIPAMAFAGFRFYKKQVTTESNLLYAGILSLVISILFFVIAFALPLPWIPNIDVMQR